MDEFGLFIDGRRQGATGGVTYDSVNPATGEPWARVAAASPADVERAVAASNAAHRSGVWRERSPEERAAVLEAIATEAPVHA